MKEIRKCELFNDFTDSEYSCFFDNIKGEIKNYKTNNLKY